ncbi:MAG TPA: hypothetical protein VGH85_04085 [Mycobacteriales bacterium]
MLAPAFLAVTFVAPAPRAALVDPAFVPEALVLVGFLAAGFWAADFWAADFWAVPRFAAAFVADVRPDADVFFDVGPAEATPLVAPPRAGLRAGDLPVLSATVELHRLHVTRQAPVGACRWPNDRK